MTTTKVDDQQLIEALLDPNRRELAFSQLVTRYHEQIYWHIRRIVLYHEDANDVVQNTFVKAFKGIEKFRGDAKIYTWLYRIATNEAITFRNTRRRRLVNEFDDDLAQSLKADPYFDGDEIEMQLQLAMNSLPDRQKAVFIMRYFNNLSYNEIADILETSEGALKASFHHARKKIEHYFKLRGML